MRKIPCATFTLTCTTCGIYQPKWSEYRHRGCADRCWCTRHGDCNCCDCS